MSRTMRLAVTFALATCLPIVTICYVITEVYEDCSTRFWIAKGYRLEDL